MMGARLRILEPGLWISEDRPALSYPASGNAECLRLEEGSFWFRMRNDWIGDAMLSLSRRAAFSTTLEPATDGFPLGRT